MASILDILVQSGVFILLLYLFRPLLKRHLSARTRHTLWLIPALRLALPLRVDSALSLWAWLAPAPAKPAAFVQAGPSLPLPARAIQPALSFQALDVPTANPAVGAAPATSMAWEALLPQLLVWGWVAGAAVMLGYVIISSLRLQRPVKGMQPFFVPEVPLPLYVVPGLDSPCLAGLVRPRIMLNRAAIQTETLLNMVISHELTHYKRKDHLWAALRSLLLCAWWWNPLVWLMASLSREDSEAACDEAVTLHMDAHKRETYGMSLIALMQTDLKVSRLLTADTAMSCGKRQMKERIAMIANLKKKRRGPALALALVLALMMPLLFTSASQATPAPAADAPPTSTINTQEIIQMMTEEEAIKTAKDAVMSYVVYDAGIQGFSNIKAEIAWREWAGIWSGMWVVTLDAATGSSQERLEVRILPEDKAAVYIGQGNAPLWEGPGYRPEIPRDKNQQAWAKEATHLNNYPYARDYPAMILFPGAAVTLARVTPAVGGNTQEEWADVILGNTDSKPEVSGYVPLGDLVYEKPEAPVLKGSIQTDKTPLLKNTGLTGDAWSTLKIGQEVTLLGQSLHYYYVQAGDAAGYVPLDALNIDDKTQAALAAFQPEDPFDNVEPGWMPRKAEYEKKLHTLYNQYGDVSEWPLEGRAQGSKIALEYGFTWLHAPDGGHMIQVLPEPGELGQEEAYQIALKAAMGEFGFDEKMVMRHSINFAHHENSPDKREWDFTFWLIGAPNCAVRLDNKGQVLDMRQLPGPVVGENAVITMAQAVKIARDALANQESASASQLDSWPMRVHYTFDFEEGTEREYWEVSFRVPDAVAPGMAGDYVVRVNALTGDVIGIWNPEGNG